MREMISIHAPVKGATLEIAEEEDDDEAISIHAPVKGATSNPEIAIDTWSNFNPRTREGCDVGNLLYNLLLLIFQSTHP